MSVLPTPPEELSRLHSLALALHFNHAGECRDPWVAERLSRAFKALHQAQVDAWNHGLTEDDPDRLAAVPVDLDQRWEEYREVRFGGNDALMHGFIGALGRAVYNTDARDGSRLLAPEAELDLYQLGERPALHILAGIPRL